MEKSKLPLIKPKNKILILTQSFIRFKEDILSKHIFVLAQLLNQKGWEVLVLAPHAKGLKKYEEIDGVKIYRFQYFFQKYERIAYSGMMQRLVFKNPINPFIFIVFFFFFTRKALSLIKEQKPDVLHAHWWLPSGMVGCLVSKITKLPLVLTLHGTDVGLIDKSSLFLFLAKKVLNCARKITVVSNFIKNKLILNLGTDADKFSVIPMPVDQTEIFPKQVPPGKRKLILSVARFTQQKEPEVLINAFYQLKKKNIEAELIMIGEGPERGNLEKLINSLSLDKEVSLLDFMPQEKLNEYYNRCDMLVLSSVNEGFGLVLVEAQFCKKPVIGTDSGGIPDIIIEGKTGLLFPPGDVNALAKDMESLLEDKKLAQTLAQKGYESAWANFSAPVIQEKYTKVLNTLISH
jgi:glycosyltransferase involved in cell wall biosynthesis